MFSEAIYKTLNLTEEVEMNDANNIHKAQQIGVIKQTTDLHLLGHQVWRFGHRPGLYK